MDSWQRTIHVVQGLLTRIGPHVAAALLLCSPLFPGDVLVSGDLNNHVRHVHESMLALREGQWPPVLAPSLNQDLRLRIFQLYSGTSFLLPGLLSFLLSPYLALKVVLVCASVLGALSVRSAARMLGAGEGAALIGATAFQLAPFPTLDLLNRGAWPEWLALQVGAVVLLMGLRLVVSATIGRFAAFVGALAFLIPCHPLQTALLAIPIASLILAFAVQSGVRRAPFFLLVVLAALSAVLLTAWFWAPMLAVWGEQRMIACDYTHAYIGTPAKMALWPWARQEASGFSAQLGLPLLLGLCVAPLVAYRRRSLPLAVAAGLGWLLLIGVVSADALKTFLPRVAEALSSLQYTYRYLIPATLLGSLALVGAAQFALERTRHGLRWVIVGMVVIVAHAMPYVVWCKYSADGWPRYGSTTAALAADFVAENSRFYTLVGTDFYRLAWAPRGVLRLDERIGPLLGGRRSFRARLHGDGLADLRVEDLRDHSLEVGECAGEPVTACREIEVPSTARFGVRFESANPVHVRSMAFRPGGETSWVRFPDEISRNEVGDARWSARIRVATPGVYQLPVAYFPSDLITIDGEPAQQASADRTLVIVALTEGEHLVEVETRRGLLANVLSFIGLGVVFGTLLGRRLWAQPAQLELPLGTGVGQPTVAHADAHSAAAIGAAVDGLPRT